MIKSFFLWSVFFIVNKTCKWKFHGETTLNDAYKSDSPVLICLWHGLFIFPLIYLKKYYLNTKIISSTHKDSLVLAKILEYYGFTLIKHFMLLSNFYKCIYCSI